MKVDFDAPYREIARALNASSKPNAVSEQARQFGPVLAELLPQTAQQVENKNDSLVPLTTPSLQGDVENGPMASFRFDEPASKAPELGVRSVPLPEVPSVNSEPQGVKTPAVLALRRVAGKQLQRAEPERRAESIEKIQRLVVQAGTQYGIDPALSMSVVSVESDFNTRAVSADRHRSKGLFQLLDSTGKHLTEVLNTKDKYDPFHPEQNVSLGVGYLRYLHEVFSQKTQLGDRIETYPAANSSSLEKLAVAAFNAGEGRVASAQSRAAKAGLNPAEYAKVEAYLPVSTREYVERVMKLKASYDTRFLG